MSLSQLAKWEVMRDYIVQDHGPNKERTLICQLIENAASNGPLIAEAPAMYEALKLASREIARGGHPTRWDTVHKIDAILSRIDGFVPRLLL